MVQRIVVELLGFVLLLPTYSEQSVKINIVEADNVASLSVRPWFDTAKDLELQAFAANTPSRRQQLLLEDKQLKDDGRVLALHGVVAGCTIKLVSAGD